MRKVFLDVGTHDAVASLEALKEENQFDCVFAFEENELKVEFHRLHMLDISSLNTEWVVENLLLTDYVFMRVGRHSRIDIICELLASGALKRCRHIFIDTDIEVCLQPFCRENDITVHTMERLTTGRTRKEAFAHWFRICDRYTQSLSWLLPCLHPNFRWVSARYGSTDYNVDVLDSLISKIDQNQGRLLVSNQLCGVDPCPGIGKQLIIKCMINNVERTVNSWEGCHLFITDRPATAVSFMLRCRNEEKTLLRALCTLEHLLDCGVGYEVVVVLHNCTDKSREIADNYACVAPVLVRVLDYNGEVSRAGLQTFVTDESHECSFVAYCNWCFEQTSAPFLWKWDSDFELNADVAEEVASIFALEKFDNRPLVVNIMAKIPDQDGGGIEPYLSSAVCGYTKFVFWEVPRFLAGVRYVSLKNWFLHNDFPQANPKPYWEVEPWFAHHTFGSGYVFKRRFEALKHWLATPVARDMARSCSVSFNASMCETLKDMSIQEVDRLWAETTVIISSCGDPHLLRRTIQSFVEMNTAIVKACIVIENSGCTGINDSIVDSCPFPVKLIYKPQPFEIALDLVRTEFVLNIQNGTVFEQKSFIEKAVPLLFTDSKVLGVYFGKDSSLQLTRVACMHGQHNCRAKFEASGHFALQLK